MLLFSFFLNILLFFLIRLIKLDMADMSITRKDLKEIFDRKLQPLNSKIDDVVKTMSFISEHSDDPMKRFQTLEEEKDIIIEEN